MAKPGKKKKVLFVLEIIVLLLFIGVVVIMAYTFMGGYFAVVWTDFFQAG